MKRSTAEVHLGQAPLTEETGTQPSGSRYRWVMLALVWLLYTAFGVVSRSLAPLITPVLRDLNISYSQMGLIIGSWPLTYIVVAAMGGTLIDRWGIRKSLFLGIVIIGLSEVLRYFASGFITMFLFVALFGLGGPMISVGCPKTIAEWFKGKERATAVGIYTTGPRIGGLIALSTANSVVMPLTGYSWRLTFVLYGLLAFAAASMWWFLARDTRPTGVKESSSIMKVFRGLIGLRNVQLVLTMGFLSFSVTHGFGDWLPRILEVGGLPPAVAGYAASIPIAVGVPAVLLVPRLVTPRARGRIAALLALAMAVSVLIAATTSGALLVLGLVLWGLSSTCITPLLMLILMDIPQVGTRYMGSAGGMYFSVAEIGGFAGPFMIGVASDLTGGFLTGTVMAAGLALAVAAMALQLRPGPPEARG
ncbi:MAG: MFS transporter [Chloroflexota bacterium]